jgi:hypothetical protein
MEPLVFYRLCDIPTYNHGSYSQLTQLAAVVVPTEPTRVVYYDAVDEEVEQVGVVHNTDRMAA